MGRKRGMPVDGWLVIDKPSGMTSTQVVGRARYLLDARKAGHGGTLDPLATGLLPIAFGKATKTVPYIMDGRKVYRFTLRMGESRDSDDAEGAVTGYSAIRPDDDELRAALPALTGDIMQVPPVFSALKVGGQRSYDMARAGRPPELPPRPARVDRFELIERVDRDTAIFEVESGKGVYMRALARDVALACGTVGYITALRRLRVGPFTEADAITLDKLVTNDEKSSTAPELLYPVATVLADIPALALTEDEAASVLHGRALSLADLEGRVPEVGEGEPIRAMTGERVLGLCRLRDGLLHPVRIF